ncbi:MAG: hypothetical protein HKP17_13135 [Ignavibacteriaceae bacterium]|nr:hypothetical protein [Ignavibacteriaceae bacterium]
MAEKGEINSYYDYKILDLDNSVKTLAIRFNKVFPDFVVYAKKTNYEGDLLDKSSYLKMFDDCEYVFNKNWGVNFHGKTYRSLVLDIEKVKKADLHIEGFLSSEEK